MILQQLYALALQENLMADLAFELQPVAWVISLDEKGNYQGLIDFRESKIIPSKKKGGSDKRVVDKGTLLSIPRAHGNTANQGFARFFVDTVPRVLPVEVEPKVREKFAASRVTFWSQIEQAEAESKIPSLIALHRLGQRINEFAEAIQNDLSDHKFALTDRVTFKSTWGEGKVMIQEEEIRKWYSEFFNQVSAIKQQEGPSGVCQVTGKIGSIPTSHPIKLQGIPNGSSTGVSLISFDKPAFGHYGFDGAQNAGLGYPATDGYLRALEALIKGTLPSVKKIGGLSHLVFGNCLFLFWTKNPEETKFMSLFDDPNEIEIQKLPKRPKGGSIEKVFTAPKEGKGASIRAVDEERFYLLGLSGNSARAIVRCYLDRRLGEVKAHVAQWFEDLRIADLSKEYNGQPNNKFPIWQLALATAFESSAVNPETSERLLAAALTGNSVADSLLISCLRRLSAKGREAFRASRMALIKLILIRKGVNVSTQLNTDDKRLPYLYGRLLAVFEQIQFAALGDVNANVVDKFYSTMSSAPGMVVGRLQDNARKHLRKLRGEKPGSAVVLEKRLMEITDRLEPNLPPMKLSLQDQGLFALGYYHEKAKGFEDAAKRKAQAATEPAQAATEPEEEQP